MTWFFAIAAIIGTAVIVIGFVAFAASLVGWPILVICVLAYVFWHPQHKARRPKIVKIPPVSSY